LPRRPPGEPEQQVGNAFRITALWVTLYHLSASLLKPLFPLYRHHWPLTLLEALPWIRAGWRKLYFAGREGHVLNQLAAERTRQFFLVPLQVHNDSRVCVHSPYLDVSEFIEEVVGSFAVHAPARMLLVIKHHPRDRGYHDYSRQIRTLRRQFGLGERLLVVHDLHLPTLLAHASGAVVINSTVGLAALHHKVPTKTTGSAFYDMDGLTYQGSLDALWAKAWAAVPHRELYQRFRGFLQHCMLLNGSFYRRLPGSRLRSGILWTGDSQWLPCETRSSAKDATRAAHAGGGELLLDRDPGKQQRAEPAHTRKGTSQ
jgi:capsular polysaccharide export protein